MKQETKKEKAQKEIGLAIMKMSQIKEHDKWIVLCDYLQGALGMTKDEFNASPIVREIVKRVEQWEYHNYKRREMLKNNNDIWHDNYGVFWNGEEIK